VQSTFGYHLIKVESHKEEGQLEFEEVKEEVAGAVAYKKQNEAFVAKLTELTDRYKDILVINK